MNAKTVILLEMLTLYVGDLIVVSRSPEYQAKVQAALNTRGNPQGNATVGIVEVIGTALRHLIAVFLLLIVLLVWANFGYGAMAAAFGGLVVLAWWVASAGEVGPQIVALEKRYLA